MTAIPAIFVFIGVFLASSLAVILASFWQDRRAAGSTPAPQGAAVPELPFLLQQESLSTISIWGTLLKRLDFAETLHSRISESGLKVSVGRVIATMMLCGVFLAALVIELPWLPAGFSVLAFAGGAALPYLFIVGKRKRRFHQFEQQFPDALDSMARALRAGHALSGALEILATEAPQPLRSELRRTIDEYKLGSSWDAALTGLAQRIPLLEIRLFTAAVLLQNRTGGRLTEVLEKLAETIRDSISLRGDVRAISAHGRLTGLILTLLPILIAATMYYTSPGYLSVLLYHPLGPTLITTAGIFLLLGHLVIKKIVSIKI